jgi:hypothetical protein
MVTKRDNGAKALLDRLGKGVPTLRVGVYGDAALQKANDSPNATVGEIAASHEFGLGPPQRSFIREPVAAHDAEIRRGLRAVAEAVFVEDGNPIQVLEQLGLVIEGFSKQAIADGIAPPLSDRYLKRKLKKYPGATTPLIASGQMRASIAHEIESTHVSEGEE